MRRRALQAIDDWQHRRQQEMERVTFDASQHGNLDVDLPESTDRGVTLRKILCFLELVREEIKQRTFRPRQYTALESLYRGMMGWRRARLPGTQESYSPHPRAEPRADRTQPAAHWPNPYKDSKSDFGVSFPDFPGCVTAGKTLEEARRMAAEALALHIGGMAEDGEAIPPPSTIDDVAADPAMRGAVAFLVSADLEKTVRVNITARESQIDAIDRRAGEAGMTRSAYMVQSALGRDLNKKARPSGAGSGSK